MRIDPGSTMIDTFAPGSLGAKTDYPLESVLQQRFPVFSKPLIVIVGGYGSGKSEISINLARYLANSSTTRVNLADLDIINPYFRSREAAVRLKELGIHLLVPPGAQAQADLPIVIPEIKGAISSPAGTVILDVGGDDAGARVLSSLQDAFRPGGYELLFVVNSSRPFTSTVDGTCRIMDEISVASRLEFTGLIANTHLLDDTTVKLIMAGLEMTKEVSDRKGVPITFLSAKGSMMERIAGRVKDIPLLPLDRSLLKPWERGKPADQND